MSRNPIIRNSTAEFLIFTSQAKEGGIEVRYENGTIWLTQKQIAELFDTSTDNIGLHLKNIYADRELEEKATTEDSSVVQQADSVIRNFRITAADGKKTARLTTQNEHFLPISAWICIQKPDFIYILWENIYNLGQKAR